MAASAAATSAVVLPLALALYYGAGGTADNGSAGSAAVSSTLWPSGTSPGTASGSTNPSGGPSDATGGGAADSTATADSSATAAASGSGGGSAGSAANPGSAADPATGGVSSGGELEGFVLIAEDESPSDPTSGAPEDPPPSAVPATSAASDPTPSDPSSSVGSAVGSGATPSAFDGPLAGALVEVEEDWELQVSQPDPNLAAPQVGTVMTPFGDASDFYLAFALNHRFSTSYVPGGMEIQLWWQGQQLGWVSVGDQVLSSPNEKITWTQRLEIQGGKLRFTVMNGQSTTWGAFGQGDSLHLSVATTLEDLNDYRPSVSVANSGVTFASNRVGSLVLKAVRGYSASGQLLAQDAEPIVVFSPSSN